jgi:hypothetical protein
MRLYTTIIILLLKLSTADALFLGNQFRLNSVTSWKVAVSIPDCVVGFCN